MSASDEPPVAPLGAREALGSHWSFGIVGWGLTLVPASALVALQEFSLGRGAFSLVVASVVAQAAVVAALGLPVAAILRRRRRVLPVPLIFAAWVVIGAARGLTGGVIAIVSAAPPDLAPRVLYWIHAGVVWMPLLSYVLAQLAHRRVLLARLSAAERRHREARRRAAHASRELRDSLISTLHARISPTIVEIRQRMGAMRAEEQRLDEIADRLASASADVSRAVEGLAAEPDRAGFVPASRPATVAAALAFERRRPLLWALGTGAGVVVGIGALAAQSRVPGLVQEFVAAVAVGTAALVAVSAAPRRSFVRRARVGSVDVLRYATAAGTASAVLAALQGGQVEAYTLLLIAALPVTLAFAAGVISFAAGCSAANTQLVEAVRNIDDERHALEELAEEEEARIREQLATLTHGPIQGRLAACAMALNFLAAEPETTRQARSGYIAGAVLEHLDAVMADLATLRRAARVPSTRRIPAPAVVPEPVGS